jgi:hypothetical protein
MSKILRNIVAISMLAVHISTVHAFSLFGPSPEKLEPAQIQERIREQAVAVGPAQPNEALSVHTKSAAVGGLFLGFVLGSVAASSGGAAAPGQTAQQLAQQQQQAMQIGQQLSQQATVATANAINDETTGKMQSPLYQGPAEPMRSMLSQELGSLLKIRPELPANENAYKDARYVLSVVQTEWLLDFRTLSSLYDLKYRLQTRIYDRETKTYVLSHECNGAHKDAFELEEWQANEQQKVRDGIEAISRECAGQVLAALGLRGPTTGQEMSPAEQTPAEPSSAATP